MGGKNRLRLRAEQPRDVGGQLLAERLLVRRFGSILTLLDSFKDCAVTTTQGPLDVKPGTLDAASQCALMGLLPLAEPLERGVQIAGKPSALQALFLEV